MWSVYSDKTQEVHVVADFSGSNGEGVIKKQTIEEVNKTKSNGDWRGQIKSILHSKPFIGLPKPSCRGKSPDCRATRHKGCLQWTFECHTREGGRELDESN